MAMVFPVRVALATNAVPSAAHALTVKHARAARASSSSSMADAWNHALATIIAKPVYVRVARAIAKDALMALHAWSAKTPSTTTRAIV